MSLVASPPSKKGCLPRQFASGLGFPKVVTSWTRNRVRTRCCCSALIEHHDFRGNSLVAIMSYEPLLSSSTRDSLDMPTPKDTQAFNGLELVEGRHVVRAGSDSAPEDDPTAPSQAVSSTRQRTSDLWTILCSGCALISDGYANSLMTLINVVLRVQYPDQYKSHVSTRVSNALLVGEIIGQITVG